MKKILLSFSLLLTAAVAMAQHVAVISGGLSNVTSPVAITVTYMDSLNNTSNTFLTDNAGNVQGTMSYNLSMFGGYFEVSYTDCNGVLVLMHYAATPSQTVIVISGDYCPQVLPCDANFYTYTDPATGLTEFFAANSGGATYSWDFGDGSPVVSGDSIETHSYNAPGFYDVCLTVTGGGCVDTYCQTIVIGGGGGGSCQAYFFARPDTLNPFTYEFLNLSQGNATHAMWVIDNQIVSTDLFGFSFPFSAPGTYSVCLTITDSLAGCSDTYCEPIVVDTNGVVSCYADFIFMPSNSTPGCFDFINTSYPSAPGTSFFYDFGDGITSTLENPTHCYAQQGVYNVTLTIQDGQCSSTMTSTVFYNGQQSCNAFFFPYIDSAAATPFVLTLINASTGSFPNMPLLYAWDFGDGSTSTDAYPTHQYATTGLFNICLTVFDTLSGCTSTFCDSLGIDSTGAIMMRGVTGFTLNVISPVTSVTTTSADVAAEMTAFPNPISADGILNVQLKAFGDDEASIQVFNTAGVSCIREVIQTNNNATHQLNMSNLPSGLYIIQASSGKHSAQTRVLVP